MEEKKGLLCVALLFLFALATVRSQAPERFELTVTGTFLHSAIGDVPVCDYCDCGGSSCQWMNNVTCDAAFGPDDNQQRWGNCTKGCKCFSKSGVGFQGVSNVVVYSNLDANNITRIGRITHYNNVINGGSPYRLRLTLTIVSPQLQNPFYIAYPLQFIETDNGFSFSDEGCDPAIQRTNTTCDDRFSFEKLFVSSSFTYQNIKYTLEVVGFLNNEDINQPIRNFVTREGKVSRADVYARLITFCVEQDCPSNYDFQGPPVCGCVCAISDDICQAVLGDGWRADNETCDCVCAKNETQVCAGLSPGILNPQTCGCDCNVTDAYCAAIDPDFGVAVAPRCACDCKRQTYLDCYEQNPFLVPDITSSCECVCRISDGACENRFGDGYSADYTNCVCIPPGGDGLTDGDIAGIVIGSTAGALGLLCLMLCLAGLLVWLIRTGKIPGIYGYRIEVADLSEAQNSPFYKDVWSQQNALQE